MLPLAMFGLYRILTGIFFFVTFTLVRVVADPEPIPVTLGAMWVNSQFSVECNDDLNKNAKKSLLAAMISL